MRKTSIISWFGFDLPHEDGFKLIKQAGFDGVLLWWGDEFGDNQVKYSLPDIARRAGLFVENIHSTFEQVNTLWFDRIEGDAFEKALTDSINDCAKYEIPTVIIHSSKGDTPPAFNNIGLDRFKRLVDTAERKNVNIALENLRKPEYLDFIFSNIQSDRLGFCYDSGHNNIYSDDKDMPVKFGGKLMALHLHDNDGTDDQHVLPFEGNIDWGYTMRQIYKTGYPGPISLESFTQADDSKSVEAAEEYLEKAHKTALKLIELMKI